MYLANPLACYRSPLDPKDALTYSLEAAGHVARLLALRDSTATPLVSLPALAGDLGLGALYVKDEGSRLGLGSFKALGGAYAMMQLVLDAAERKFGERPAAEALLTPPVRAIAAGMTFACATDGNHGRSVAQGAALTGAQAVIFVHAGVSQGRIDAIAAFGARIIRVAGSYDDSVREAARVAEENGWTVLSDTSWEGYEEIPALVGQGYIALVTEALAQLPAPPTHVFLQAGVGGFASAVAAHLAVRLGAERPHITVVEPARAACVFESARAGQPVQVPDAAPTVMAMLECYAPSPIAFRVLARLADGFMTVEEEDAVAVMRRLAFPLPGDPAVVAGESGGAGLAGVMAALRDSDLCARIGLDARARVLVINTEGATDPEVYRQLTGADPHDIRTKA
ncbi:diaminopropionate ammonia-lyase [Falsigemmobacter intermedius]|uniref:Diaminopropionate ammonia-lyase n=1 Tax=Falsigemmobacter intermedius TaxID=1553448 RepID=A0A3S3UY50_9RHOB|nr:diaminopropionate ammonia-lyase [Falsigemmobacter intermedius]RWY38465.1 diaminopropionate ammonia-lyase [Falsigemmobacter intermedius]